MGIIKDLRQAKYLTQAELAEQVGVSVQSIKNWEAQRGMPKRASRQRLSRILECKQEDIIDDIANGGKWY